MAGQFRPRGIVGVTGTEPVGAAVTIGVKDQRGVPTQKDWLHIQCPHQGPDGRREPHPAFSWWNDLPSSCIDRGRVDTRHADYRAHSTRRRMVRGVVAHTEWERCLVQHYMGYRARGKTPPPDGRPWCTGDGERAVRFFGEKGDDDRRTVPCPGEECPHRQNAGRGTECKPSSVFLFRLSFSDAVMSRYSPPTPVVRFASGGWRTFRALQGLRESLDRAAAAMGMSGYSPLGYNFTLTLQEGTSTKDGGRRYPFVSVSPDQSAVDFLVGSQRTRERLSGGAQAISGDDYAEAHQAISGPVRGDR